MNSQIAKKRIGDVIRVDTITNNQSDFMATHVEIKNIQLSKSYAGRSEKILTEEDALNQYVLNPSNRHQLILVVGLNGTGKSHLIRWFSTKLFRLCPENEVILFIRRSDNSLRGTIKQLLELEEVAHIPNKEVYDRLVRASTIIDDKKLKDMIYQNFIVEILNDDKMMQQARDEMNRYIYNAVNWQIEGVSIDNISKFTSKRFIEFERQSKDVGKALITLPASQETQNVLEAFVAFVTLGGGQSWNFEGAPWQQFQVQYWFEKIKPEIIKGVKFFHGVEVDYQECALSAEMLREILFGQYKGTTVGGMQEKLLWESTVEKIPANAAHCNEWISLMQSMNDNAQRIKDTIFNYYNIVQGTGGKNKYIYYSRLLSDFQKVQKRRLHIDESILSNKDSFKPRDEIRNIFRDIQGKLQVVCGAEVALAQNELDRLGLFIDYVDIEDEDILEIVDRITEFYDATSSARVNVTYDTSMINVVRREAEPIANAVKKVVEAVKLTDSLDILMAFSQDPLIRVSKLLELLTKAENDIKFVQRDVEKRREKLVQKSAQTGDRYVKQQEVIESNLEIIKGWEV